MRRGDRVPCELRRPRSFVSWSRPINELSMFKYSVNTLGGSFFSVKVLRIDFSTSPQFFLPYSINSNMIRVDPCFACFSISEFEKASHRSVMVSIMCSSLIRCRMYKLRFRSCGFFDSLFFKNKLRCSRNNFSSVFSKISRAKALSSGSFFFTTLIR